MSKSKIKHIPVPGIAYTFRMNNTGNDTVDLMTFSFIREITTSKGTPRYELWNCDKNYKSTWSPAHFSYNRAKRFEREAPISERTKTAIKNYLDNIAKEEEQEKQLAIQIEKIQSDNDNVQRGEVKSWSDTCLDLISDIQKADLQTLDKLERTTQCSTSKCIEYLRLLSKSINAPGVPQSFFGNVVECLQK